VFTDVNGQDSTDSELTNSIAGAERLRATSTITGLPQNTLVTLSGSTIFEATAGTNNLRLINTNQNNPNGINEAQVSVVKLA
jgi:hypothetical protein